MLKSADMKVLVIGAIDGSKLAPVLQKAAEKNIKVIAYDRLIRDTTHVDYYTTFDNFQVGVLQGSDIIERLGLDKGKGPFTIELFGGSADDNNAFFFTTAPCRCSSRISTKASWSWAQARLAWTRCPPCAGAARWRVPA